MTTKASRRSLPRRVDTRSLRLDLLELPDDKRNELIDRLSPDDAEALEFDWSFWARAEQLWRPGPERDTWYLSGRGFGKTRTGAEAVRYVVEHMDELGGDQLFLAGRTASSRNAEMLYGPSGLMRVFPPAMRPIHKVRQHIEEVTFPCAPGVVARLMSGDVPDSFRGPGFVFGWTDEAPHWPRFARSWEMLQYTLREGRSPKTINTTTPLPDPLLLRELFEHDVHGHPIPDPEHPTGYKVLPHVRIVTGSSYDNAANLATDFVRGTLRRLAASDIGRQEIHGAILLDVPGALWRRSDFRHDDVESITAHARTLSRVAIGVDPAGSSKSTSAETGIVAGGIDGQRVDLLADRSGHYGPEEWGRVVIDLYDELQADEVAAETNFGAEMVRSTIDLVSRLPEVVRARRERGTTRPIIVREVTSSAHWAERARYVQGRWRAGQVRHVGDPRQWVALEHQMTHGRPELPKKEQRLDRLDAAVHLVRHLVTDGPAPLAGLDASTDQDAFWRRVRAGLG